jgi:hypothetical protein
VKGTHEEKGTTRTARVLFAVAAVLALIAVAGYVTFSLAPVRRGLKSKFDELLLERLGPGTVVDQVSVGLKSVELSGVVFPLDKQGSRLRIRDIQIAITPFDILRRPELVERVVRSVRISGAEILIASGEAGEKDSTDSAWLPEIKVPGAVYAALGRLDSLKRVDLDGLRVLLQRTDQAPLTLCEVKGTVERRDGEVFRLNVAGRYLGDSSRTLDVTGAVAPRKKTLELQAVAGIPSGPVPGLGKSLPPVTTGGGRVSVRLTAADSSAILRGAASVDDIHVTTPAGVVEAKSLYASLAADSILIEPMTLALPYAGGEVGGVIVLRDKGRLNLNGEFASEDLAALRDVLKTMPPISGRVKSRVAIRGDFSAPLADVTLESDSLGAFDQAARNVRARVALTPARLDIETFSFETSEGTAELGGSLGLSPQPMWNVRGRFGFARVPTLLGWTSAVRELRFNAIGPLLSPSTSVTFVGADGGDVGTAGLRHSGDVWMLDVGTANGASHIEVQAGNDTTQVTAQNLQHVLTLLFPDVGAAISPLQEFDMKFAGDASGGLLAWDAQIKPDSVGLLPQIARDVHFSGRYDRTNPAHVAMSGKWSGTAGDGYPFEGRADVTLADRVLNIDRVFIDAAGELKGRVDIPNRTVDLELTVGDLDLDRLPLRPVTESALALKGTLSGVVKAWGTFDRPEWSADLSMINGSVFSVPGYWLNLDASGQGLAMTVHDFELGRDVRKIIEASGNVDFRASTIAVTAEVGSARAEDFLLALIGQEGILSGELTGRAAVSGALTRPDVEAEITVRNGELFNELQVDEFTATARMGENAAGERILRIPRAAFSKTNTYQFALSGDVIPKADGELHAHIEGKGDFLDLVDQLERSFRTMGSDGNLLMDFGGTLSHPRFLGGKLSVAKGMFAYPDATPSPVATEVNIELAPTGEVQTGKLSFRSGEQWVQIETLPDCDSSIFGLEPLIIPKPHVCLGVLKIESGDEGMPLHLPGLMKNDWTGTLVFGATAGRTVTISGYGENRLLIAGNAELRNSRITFPFVGGGGKPGAPPRKPRPVERWLLERLEQAKWNLDVAVGSGDRYDVELTSLKNSNLFGPLKNSVFFGTLADYFDHLSIDAMLDPGNTPLGIRGTIDDATFHLNGRASSLRGKVDYLDQTFNIDHVYADFDETAVMPVLEGRATTFGVDTVGRSIPVYLTLYQIDRETGTRQPRGRLDEMTVVLESDANQSPEQVLQLLGFNAGTDVRGKAEQLMASTVARALSRQWLSPLTRRLERWTLLDEITISPGGGRGSSLARQQRVRALQDSVQQTSAFRFFTGSQVTVGKYLTRDVFFTYTGELSEGALQLKDRLGLIHSWNLEYRINPLSRDLVLDLAVEYDEVERRRDESVSLKYFFALEP